MIQESLPDNQESYKDSHIWFQSRMSIPQITLDQLTLIPPSEGRKKWKCRLDCAIPDLKDRLSLGGGKRNFIIPTISIRYRNFVNVYMYRISITIQGTDRIGNTTTTDGK